MGLAVVGLSLWNAWQIDYPPPQAAQNTSARAESNGPPLASNTNSNSEAVPISSSDAENPSAVFSTGELVHVKTDVLDVSIDLNQGNIITGDLLDYPQSVADKNQPFVLLQNQPNERYVANSSLFIANGQTAQAVDFEFKTEQKSYQLSSNQNQLIVVLEGHNQDGLLVKKEFTFIRGSYLIAVDYKISNNTDADWKGFLNTQLLRSSPKEDKSSMFHVGSYTGASFSNPGTTRFKKVSFADMGKTNLNLDVKGGWIAMQQHYFLSAWVPNADTENKFYTRATNGDFSIGVVSQPITVKPQEQKNIGSKLYIGPEITSVLKSISPSLDLTVDYGMLWFVSSLLFSLMKAIYNVIGNWGWSIVLVTVLIKLAFYRLSATSYKSMAGMRKLQPKLQALRERYGDDKAKISQATMELYRQEKVNPLGGCLPIVIQIPVFIALYWVLLESVGIRGPLPCSASDHGCYDAGATKTKSSSTRSFTGKSNDVFTHTVYWLILEFPSRFGLVLDSK
jgi:YidC/Oxa1 family membrane protein insertase